MVEGHYQQQYSTIPAAAEEEEMPKYAASKNMMKGAVRMSIILKKFIKFTAALRGHTRYILVQGEDDVIKQCLWSWYGGDGGSCGCARVITQFPLWSW